MRLFSLSLSILLVFFNLIFASLLVQAPENDPFYVPANGFENAKNGDVLKDRNVIVAISGTVPVLVEAHQLQFRTESINGSAITTITTVMKPLIGAKLDKFITFQTAEDSVPLKCSPSYILQLGANQNGSIIEIENLFIQTYLIQGYIVNSPDYEGPDGAFTAGRLSGRGVLDSIRAVKNYGEKIGLDGNPAVIGIGYSGGAIATGWAASLQSTYAPDLNQNIKGWVLGGTPANLSSIVEFIDGTEGTGFLFTSAVGLSRPSSYGNQLQPILQNISTSYAKEAFQFVKTHCVADVLVKYANETFQSTKYFTIGNQFFSQPTISNVIKNQTMGLLSTERPIQPVLLYHAKHDNVIPYQVAVNLNDQWCKQGTKLKFITIENGDHTEGEVKGVPIAHKFVDDIFNGKNPITTCIQEIDSSSNFDSNALGDQLQPLLSELKDSIDRQSRSL